MFQLARRKGKVHAYREADNALGAEDADFGYIRGQLILHIGFHKIEGRMMRSISNTGSPKVSGSTVVTFESKRKQRPTWIAFDEDLLVRVCGGLQDLIGI